MSEQLRLWAHVEPASSEPRERKRAPRVFASLPTSDVRTLRQLAREALLVQDACNLSGVVHGYSRAMSRLWALLPDASTQGINHHPIARLWADKCASLTGTQTGIAWVAEAYAAVRELAGEKDERADS